MIKKCRKCGIEKDLSEYPKHPQMRDGHLNRCKDCTAAYLVEHRSTPLYKEKMRKYLKEWRISNMDRKREIDTKWRNENREQCRSNSLRWNTNNPEAVVRHATTRRLRSKLAGKLSSNEWNSLLNKYDNCCLCCGKREDGDLLTKLTPDHIKPLCLGGQTTIDNIQPLCYACNRNKNKREIDYRPVAAGAM